MTATPSHPDVSTSVRPMPHPTHPVAGRPVDTEAPEFDWIPVPETDGYRLQLAATEAFESLFYDQTVDGPTALSLPDVLPDDTSVVWWRVRADTAEAIWSPPAHFAVSATDAGADDQTFLVDAPPVLIHPVEEDSVEPSAASFSWESVPEASGYRLQIGATDAFDELEVDLTFDQTASVTLYDVLPTEVASFSWRVQALFPNDTAGPWSEAGTFRAVPEEGGDQATVPATDVGGGEDPSNPRQKTAVAAGPAREAHTSNVMALTFVLVLVVSFVLTLLAIKLIV